MTEMMQQAIDRLQALPEDRQDLFAHRILARIEEEQRKEAALLADLDKGLADLDEGRASAWDKAAFLKEAQSRGASR